LCSRYVDVFGLAAPSDDISEVLDGVARRTGALLPGGKLNTELAAQRFVARYRTGALGCFVLDDDDDADDAL
jgi:ribosome biogenesis GTPase A